MSSTYFEMVTIVILVHNDLLVHIIACDRHGLALEPIEKEIKTANYTE